MKRILVTAMCLVAFLVIVTGCSSETKSNVNPAVDNGTTDESYIGEPNPVKEENYKQTSDEAKKLEELKQQIEQEENVEEEETTDGGHAL